MTTSVTNFFKNLPDFQVEPENHAKRKEMGLNAGKKLEKSVETFDFSQLAGKKYHIPIPAYIPYAGDPRWKDAPLGPVNTLENTTESTKETIVTQENNKNEGPAF